MRPTQVDAWLRRGFKKQNESQHGQFAPGMHQVQFSLRWVGAPAASGRKQVLITTWDQISMSSVLTEAWSWWTTVPVNIATDGWRFCPVRWFQ